MVLIKGQLLHSHAKPITSGPGNWVPTMTLSFGITHPALSTGSILPHQQTIMVWHRISCPLKIPSLNYAEFLKNSASENSVLYDCIYVILMKQQGHRGGPSSGSEGGWGSGVARHLMAMGQFCVLIVVVVTHSYTCNSITQNCTHTQCAHSECTSAPLTGNLQKVCGLYQWQRPGLTLHWSCTGRHHGAAGRRVSGTCLCIP